MHMFVRRAAALKDARVVSRPCMGARIPLLEAPIALHRRSCRTVDLCVLGALSPRRKIGNGSRTTSSADVAAEVDLHPLAAYWPPAEG